MTTYRIAIKEKELREAQKLDTQNCARRSSKRSDVILVDIDQLQNNTESLVASFNLLDNERHGVMSQIEAYPLQWPNMHRRTDKWQRETARFDTNFVKARDVVVREIELLTGRKYRYGSAYGNPSDVIISTNVNLRRDGLPLAGQRQPDDPGVAVYFKYKDRQMCFACDRWKKIEDNMQAIALTISALRGINRWGTGDMLEAAFTGFTALPAPIDKRDWRHVFGLNRETYVSPQVLRDAYRQARSDAHPDRPGGSTDRFNAVQRAYEEGCRELGVSP